MEASFSYSSSSSSSRGTTATELMIVSVDWHPLRNKTPELLVTCSSPNDRRNSRTRTTTSTRTTGESPYRTTVPQWKEIVSQVSVLAGWNLRRLMDSSARWST